MNISLQAIKKRLLFLLIGLLSSYFSLGQITVTNNNASGAGSLAAALDAIVAGQTITISPAVTGNIVVKNLQVSRACTVVGHANITIQGTGTYDHGRAWLDNLLTIVASNVTIRDLKLTQATGPNAWSGTGILMADGLSNITLNNVTVTDCKNGGVANSTWVAGVGTSVGLTNMTITNSSFSGNGTSGVILSHTDNLIISGTTSSGNNEHGIFLNGNTQLAGTPIPSTNLASAKGVTNGSLTNNTCSNNGAGGVAGGGIVVAGNSTNNVIDNCSTLANREHGIWLRLASSDNTIQNSTSSNNGGGSLACGINISLGGNENNIIKGNTCTGNQNFGIYLYDNYGLPNDNNTIDSNRVSSNGAHGIYILNSTNTTVKGNSIHTNGTDALQGGDGINFGNSSSGGEISDNEVYSNAENGINITEGGVIAADGGDANTVAIPAGGSNDNKVFDNFVGIKKDGTVAGNILNGIKILKSSGNQVGVGGRNFVSGNGNHGIYLDEIPVGTQSIVRGNYIGTDSLGIVANGNTLSGIFLSKCKQVLIDSNLISGNIQDGIQLGDAAANVVADVIQIESNLIGLDKNGTAVIPNLRHGINVDNAKFIEIGNGTSGGRNIISGNLKDGIVISNDASNVTIDDNYIGLDTTGVVDLGNGLNGIDMIGANTNKILRNYISGNVANGIYVKSATTASNVIQKNTIGLNVNNAIVANDGDGINLESCKDNKIGGLATEGNVIAGNKGNGISLNGANTDDNIIGGNYIGVDTSSNVKANTLSGIYIASTATSNEIGTKADGSSVGNIISGNQNHGIYIDGSENNKIDGNIIGLNKTRTTAIPNKSLATPNTSIGIYITGVGATGNEIGHVAKNYIAGKHAYQLLIENGANNNSVRNTEFGSIIADGESLNSAIRIEGATTTLNIIGNKHTDKNTIIHSTNSSVLLSGGANVNTIQANLFEGSNGLSPVSAIEVNGSGSNFIGGDSLSKGNIIAKTSNNAIFVHGNSDGNQVRHNYIGVDESSLSQGPIKGHGILLIGAGVQNTTINHNTIGNLDNATKSGIYIDSVSAISQLYGNFIGITTNDLAVANAGNGVTIANSSDKVSIGQAGKDPNIISNNVGHGIEVSNATTTKIVNNYIGTDKAGNVAQGNTKNGIHISTSNNSVDIDSNVVAGNGLDGILVDAAVAGTNIIQKNKIGLGKNGTANLPNGTVGTVGSQNGIKLLNSDTKFTVTANEITGHVGNQIILDGSDNHVITNNFLGTNIALAGSLGGTGDAVLLTNGSSTVGITGNTITGASNGHGIHLDNTATNTNVSIDENVIGISAINKNSKDGIYAEGASTLVIGTAGKGNTIAFNGANGVNAKDVTTLTISANTINQNTVDGINFDSGNTNVNVNLANVIYGNQNGIDITANLGGTSVIDGNTIGNATTENSLNGILVKDQTSALTISANTIAGNTQDGLKFITGVTGTMTVNSANIIHNNANGINIVNGIGASSVINGNTIGHATTKNATNGILVSNQANTLTISANTIAGNTGDGVNFGASVTGVMTVNSANIIHNNTNGIHITAGVGTNSIINGNTIGNATTKNTANGILVTGHTSLLTISGNTIESNTTNGVNLMSCTDVLVTANEINLNTGQGINVETSANNNFLNNNFSCNADGIVLANSGNNSFLNTLIPSYKPNMVLEDVTTNGGNTTLEIYTEASLSLTGSGFIVQVYKKNTAPNLCVNCGSGQNQGQYVGNATAVTIAGEVVYQYKFASKFADTECQEYLVVITDPTDGSSHFSDCSECSCVLPKNEFVANTPIYTKEAGTHTALQKASFCEGGDHTFVPSQTGKPLTDFWNYTWYQVNATDTTALKASWQPSTFASVATTKYTEVQVTTAYALAPPVAQGTGEYKASNTGYYFFKVQADGGCSVVSELVKVQEHLNPLPLIVGEDKVCENTAGETYTADAQTAFETFATAMNLTTNTSWSATNATASGGPTGTNAYATPTYDTQDFDFVATDAVITLNENYGIKSSSLIAATDLTCSATAVTHNVAIQKFPILTALTDESICDGSASTAVTLTSDVIGATYVWSATATGVTGHTVSGTTGTIGSETLALATATTQGTVDYSAYGQIEITLNDGTTKRTCEDPTLTKAYTVTVEPLPSTPNGVAVEVCAGLNTTLVAYDPANPATVTPNTYAWTGPLSYTGTGATPAITAATAIMTGSYAVEVTKNYATITGGCKANGTVDLTVNANPVPVISGEGAPCTGATEVYSLTAGSTPSGVSTYVWSNTITGETENNGTTNTTYDLTMPVTGSGDVAVTVTDDNTCVGSAIFAVSVDPPTVTVAQPDRVCDDETLTFTATPLPAGSYDYVWYTGAVGSGTVIAGATNATYDVAGSTVQADGTNVYVEVRKQGCSGGFVSAPTAREVRFLAYPTVADGTAEECEGTNVSMVSNASDIVGVTYAWSAPAGVTLAGTTTLANYTLTAPVTAGSYSVVVTNKEGTTTSCPKTKNVVVTVNANPVPVIDGEGVPCTGATEVYSLTAGSTPSGVSTYVWSNTITGETENNGTTNTTYDLTMPVTGSGDVAVTVTDDNTCVGSAIFAVSVDPPTVTVAQPDRVCDDETLTFTATPLPAGSYDYVWYTGAVGSGTVIAGATNATYDVAGSTVQADGTNVYVEVRKQGCSGGFVSAPTAREVRFLAYPTVADGTAEECEGTNVSMVSNASDIVGVTYAWSAPAGVTLAGTTTLANYTLTAPVTAGSYSVVVTNKEGTTTSCPKTKNVVVTVNANPVPVIDGEGVPCTGATEVYSLTAGSTPSGVSTYVWSNTITGETENNGTTNTTYDLTMPVTGSGDVAVTVTDDNTCVGSAIFAVSVDPPTVTVAQPDRVCDDETLTFTATPLPAGSYDYVWYTGAVGSGTVIAGATNATYDVAGSTVQADGTNVYVEVRKQGCSGGFVSVPTAREVRFLAYPTVADGTAEECEGTNVSMVSNASDIVGVTYAWSAPAGVTLAGTTTLANYTLTAPVTAGTYSVVVTNKEGTTTSCPKTKNVVVTVNANPVPVIDGEGVPCTGATEVYSLTAGSTPSGVSTYVWSNTITGETENNGTTNTTYDLTMPVTGSGDVAVTVTDDNTCVGSATFAVSVDPPTVTVAQPDRVCDDATLTFTATPLPAGSYDYVWYTGAVGSGTVIAGATNATYDVAGSTVQADGTNVYVEVRKQGCSGGFVSAPTAREVRFLAYPTVADGTAEECEGTNVSMVSNASDIVGVTYAWSAPAGVTLAGTTTLANYSLTAPVTAGTYTVEVKNKQDEATCPKTKEVVVTVNANPTPTISGMAQPCENTTQTYTADQAYPTIAWSTAGGTISGVATNQNVDIAFVGTGGDITLNVEDAKGCKGDTIKTVTVITTVIPTVAIDPPAGACEGVSQELKATPADNTVYTYTWYKGTKGDGTAPDVVLGTGATYSYVPTKGDQIYAKIEVTVTACPVTSGFSTLSTPIVFAKPVISTPQQNLTLCENEDGVLAVNVSNLSDLLGATYSWNGPVGNLASTGFQQTLLATATEGAYQVTVENGNTGCTATQNYNVDVVFVNVAIAASEDDIDFGQSVSLTATHNGTPTTYDDYTWSSEGSSLGGGQSIALTPPKTTTYTVTATEQGCSVSATKEIRVRDLVKVPSMFTPGNGDGLNDYWILTNIEDYPEAKIRVFNRWGNVVYKGVGGPEYLGNPWDGTKNGTDIPAAVYYYVIELNYKDITMNGAVTIMR